MVVRIERLIGVLLPRLAVATAQPWCLVVRQSADDIKVAGRVAEWERVGGGVVVTPPRGWWSLKGE